MVATKQFESLETSLPFLKAVKLILAVVVLQLPGVAYKDEKETGFIFVYK
ncbi:MAG: hypothetical protein ACETVO_05375 [bacterium]